MFQKLAFYIAVIVQIVFIINVSSTDFILTYTPDFLKSTLYLDELQNIMFMENEGNASCASWLSAEQMNDEALKAITPYQYRSKMLNLEKKAKGFYGQLDKFYKHFPNLDFNNENEEFLKQTVKEKAIDNFRNLKEIYEQVGHARRCMVKGYITLERHDLRNNNMIPVYILDQFLEFFSWNLKRYSSWKNIYEKKLIFIVPVWWLGNSNCEGDVIFWKNLHHYADTEHVGFTRQNTNFNAIDHPQIWQEKFYTLMEKIYQYMDNKNKWFTDYYFEFQHYFNEHGDEWNQTTENIYRFCKQTKKTHKSATRLAEVRIHLKSEKIASEIYEKRIKALTEYVLLQPIDEELLNEKPKEKKNILKKKKKIYKIETEEENNTIEEGDEEVYYETYFDINNQFLVLSEVEMKIDITRKEFENEETYHNYFSYSTIFTKLIRPKKNPEHILARLYQRLWLPQNKHSVEEWCQYYEDATTMPEEMFKPAIKDDAFGTKEKLLFRQLELDIMYAKLKGILKIYEFYTIEKKKRFKIVTEFRIIIVPALRNKDFNYGQKYPVITFWNK